MVLTIKFIMMITVIMSMMVLIMTMERLMTTTDNDDEDGCDDCNGVGDHGNNDDHNYIDNDDDDVIDTDNYNSNSKDGCHDVKLIITTKIIQGMYCTTKCLPSALIKSVSNVCWIKIPSSSSSKNLQEKHKLVHHYLYDEDPTVLQYAWLQLPTSQVIRSHT